MRGSTWYTSVSPTYSSSAPLTVRSLNASRIQGQSRTEQTSRIDSCFRSIEFAGILAGTDHPEAAALLVDFLLSPTFQEDIPLNMFVFPVNDDAELPDVFAEHAIAAESPIVMDPAVIDANRERWIEEWASIVR